jgi:hypothetical protein
MVKADHGALYFASGGMKILYNMDGTSAYDTVVRPEPGRHDVVHESIGVGA